MNEHDAETDARLSARDWLLLRWWGFRAWLRRCPECGQRGYSTASPRWENDRVAHMLGIVTPDRCRCCGKGYGTDAPENLPRVTPPEVGHGA